MAETLLVLYKEFIQLNKKYNFMKNTFLLFTKFQFLFDGTIRDFSNFRKNPSLKKVLICQLALRYFFGCLEIDYLCLFEKNVL